MKPLESSKPRGIFVTGTDTGVGKTMVTAALAAAFRGMGIDAGVMKPIHTGCPIDPKGDEILPEDSRFLIDVTGVDDPLDQITPYQFPDPAAPLVAAERSGIDIDSRLIAESFQALAGRHEVVIVEGIGGILVPFSRKLVLADLIKTLRLPALVVSRTALGTLNHTLLTLEAARARRIPVAGVLFNESAPTDSTASGQFRSTIPEIVSSLTQTSILGILPYKPNFQNQNRQELAQWFTDQVNLTPIFTSCGIEGTFRR